MRTLFSKFALATVTAAVLTMMSTPALAENFAIVVNAENGFSGDQGTLQTQIKRLYLKEQSAWPGGIESIPFGREEASPEQMAFEQFILGMSSAEIQGHWLKLKQIRGETPPRGIGSARILARQIGKNPGAFGVVLSSEAAAIAGGKVLFEFSGN